VMQQKPWYPVGGCLPYAKETGKKEKGALDWPNGTYVREGELDHLAIWSDFRTKNKLREGLGYGRRGALAKGLSGTLAIHEVLWRYDGRLHLQIADGSKLVWSDKVPVLRFSR